MVKKGLIMCKEHLNFVTKCLFQQFMQVNIGNNGQYDVLQKEDVTAFVKRMHGRTMAEELKEADDYTMRSPWLYDTLYNGRKAEYEF